MNETAFNELVGVIDEAIDLADCAVKAAEAASTPPGREVVTLVKVATQRYASAAAALHKTGAFREYTQEGLAKSLETAGPTGLLEFMEKLASKAVFPLDADMELRGDLVEKSGKATLEGAQTNESKTDLWVRCCEESGLSVRN